MAAKLKTVIQCDYCRKFVHVINKRFCCGKDYCSSQVKIEHGYSNTIKVKKTKKKTISSELRQQILERDGKKCSKCSSKQKLHVHHIVHREDGGSNEPDNLITLCDICHAEEHRGEPVYNIMIKSLFIYQTTNA
ncbi:hypothetical protein JCM16163A_41060 [Paenibacillus sp. YK5]